MRWNVLLACHNRADLTVQSLRGLQSSAQAAGVDVSFTVYDDGSTDGTSELLGRLPVDLTLIRGDGTAFWARSMASAEAYVLSADKSHIFDYVLWLNDDVLLDSDAVERLIKTAADVPDAVVVGAVRDPKSGVVSYSGLRRSGLHPLAFERVQPSKTAQDVETFNGNLVLVPAGVFRNLGGIDGGFTHGLADIDYGLRCGRAGIRVIQAPGTYGTCPRNVSPPSLGILNEWSRFTGPKGGGNAYSLRRILRKRYKFSWFLYIGVTYALWWVRQTRGKALELVRVR